MTRVQLIRQLARGGAALITALFLAGASTAESSESPHISRGRYLVKIAGCNDCHTPGYTQSAGAIPEAQWLIGDKTGWQGPWGTTYPINLRQFMQGMTKAQWLEIARQPTRPPMPWFALRDMSDEDLAALYDFIRSLGAAGPAAPAYVAPGQAVSTPVILMPSKSAVANEK